MKTFVKAAFAAALIGLAALTASAQIGQPNLVWSTASYTTNKEPSMAYALTGTFSVTNCVLATCTNVFDMPTWARNLSLTFRSQLTGSGTTTNGVIIEKSNDGLSWSLVDIPGTTSAGATFVGITTNYDMYAYRKVRMTVITATPASAPMTNGTLTLGFK